MTMTASVAKADDTPAETMAEYRLPREGLCRQIRSEFLEMPGLSLTLRQAARLWNLDAATCDAVLRALVDDGFLSHSGRNLFRRAQE